MKINKKIKKKGKFNKKVNTRKIFNGWRLHLLDTPLCNWIECYKVVRIEKQYLYIEFIHRKGVEMWYRSYIEMRGTTYNVRKHKELRKCESVRVLDYWVGGGGEGEVSREKGQKYNITYMLWNVLLRKVSTTCDTVFTSVVCYVLYFTLWLYECYNISEHVVIVSMDKLTTLLASIFYLSFWFLLLMLFFFCRTTNSNYNSTLYLFS